LIIDEDKCAKLSYCEAVIMEACCYYAVEWMICVLLD